MIGQISSKFTELETRPIVQYGFLAAITLLAAALRFYKLGEWSFWIDEIFTVNRAQAHYSTIENVIRNIPPTQNWIPLSVMLTAGVINHLGVNEWNARLIPAIIGILSIPMLYFPIKRVFNPGVSLLAVLLLAVSPWHIYWSQNARFYTSLMLFYSLSLFALFSGLENDRPRNILIALVLLYLAASERLFAFFWVPVVVIYLLLLKVLPIEKPPGFRAKNLLILLIPVTAIGVIEAFNFLVGKPFHLFGEIWWFLQYRSDDPLRLLGNISLSMGIPLMCLALFGGWHLINQKNRAGLMVFIAALVPLISLLILNPFIFTKDRYAFMILPSWIILGAISVEGILAQVKNQGRLLAVAVLILLLGDAASDNLLYYYINNGNRIDWKGAFALVKELSREGDAYVAWWPEFGPVYLGHEIVPWESINMETVEQSDKRYWFILDNETIWGNPRMKRWVESNGELIEVKYLRTPDEYQLRIYLYDPARTIPP